MSKRGLGFLFSFVVVALAITSPAEACRRRCRRCYCPPPCCVAPAANGNTSTNGGGVNGQNNSASGTADGAAGGKLDEIKKVPVIPDFLNSDRE